MKIGIVVVTTVGACVCANEIVAAAAREDKENTGAHPDYVMDAISFERYKKEVLAKNWEGLAKIILESIDHLIKAGAEFAIIPSNTPHYAIEKIQKDSCIPVLNMLETTVDECVKKYYQKVAILGTFSTMRDGLYEKSFRDKNIILVIPDLEACKKIDHLIMNEIIPSKISPYSVKSVAEVIKQLDCDAYILGCTELSSVYNEEILGKPVVDTTRLLASVALHFALNGFVE